MITSVKFASLFLLLGHLRCGATDKAELERLKKAYEAREAAQTEDIIYSFEFNKSAEIRATRKTVFYKTDYTYDTMEQFTNVPESFEPKVSEPYNRHQLWRIFNWYDKDKNEEKDNPYAKKYNKVVDRVKWFYKKLILDVEAQGKVDEETRWDAVQNRSAYQRRRLGKVEQLKQRLNWYGTPRTTSEKSILHRYLLQNTMNEDRGRCTESVSPWYKLHPPYTIADGRHMFWTWFDGSPEKRIPYAHPDYIYYDPRYEGLESAPINWTAREMDPLPWAKRRILGGYSNKWLWPPRTTPTDFWRPSKPTTWDISERSDYIYIYDEKNPRKIQYTKMESQMRDRMDSMAYEYWKSAEYRRRRKLFEEERAELLRDNNLTDSYSPEKRVLSALRAEVDPSRVLPGMHSAADRAIQKFARHFVACFAPTRRIWFNEELTLKPRFVANSSRRTVCPFDELYPTIVASNELTFYYTMKTTSTTPVSMESLYDGLDTTEEKDEQGNTRVESRAARTAQDRANANLKVNKALDALSKLTTLTKASEKHKEMEDEVRDVAAKQRGRPKKGEVEKESKGKSALRKSKVNKPRDTEVKSKRLLKRAKRNVRKTTVVDPEDDYVPMVAEDSKDVKERGSKDEDTGEVMKHRMDEEDQKNYQEIQEQYERLQQRKANISKARFYDVKETTLKKKRKPTYHYTSLDEQEAERKWNEVQKKKALKGGGGKNKNKKRKQREVTDTVDEIEPLNRQFGGQTIITTFENSTPPFEYFQQKVYPSHNLSSAQLNDEEFCRKLIPILEEENKMLMNDIKRRATEHGMEMRAAQVNVSNISELNEDESSETEGTTQPMTTLQRRKRDSANNRYKIQTDNIYSFETIMTRKKREINQTNDEKLNKLKRNLEVYNLVDEWKEKQVDLAMVSSKERRLLNEIDRLRKEMNMSHGENDPWYKQAVTEAIRRENELKLKFKDEIDEWWSKERKERRAHEKEVIEKYYNQTDQNDNEDFDKEEERKNQEELNIIKQEHEKDMAERKAKGLPPDSYEKMLPIAEEEMAEEQKKYEEECKCAPKTVDELMKEFDADVDVEKLKRNLEVYDLIEKWKKKQQEKEEKNKPRKKREIHGFNKRMKRKCENSQEDEDRSRGKGNEKVYQEFNYKLKNYKGENADDENTADVLKGLMKENAHLHATRKTGKPQDAVDTKIRDKWFKQVGDKKTYDRGLYFRDKRDIENRKWRYNKVENFEERNVAEVDDGSALLNIHRRKRDIKNRCQMHNDEKSERYDIEKLLARRKREIQANTEKLTKLKRNLEVYNLIDEWKEKQVDLEVYDLIEKWKKRQQKKDEQNKIASKRKKREVHIEKKLQRMKRKTGKDSDGEYVEDMSRYRAGKRIYKELHHKMKGYKGAGESGAVNDVMSDYMKNKKYDNPDYRKKRDLTAIASRNCNQEDDFDIVDFHIRRYGNTSIYEYVGPPASQEKQLHQQQSWQQRCQKVAHMFGIENFKVDTIRRKDELEKTQKELAQDEMNTVLRRIHQRKRNKALLRKRRDALNVSMVDDGLPLNTSHTDDKHVHLENELDRMVREYEEQQKKSPRRPKTRPTASSEYPLKEDFEPFIKSSKELREFEEREQARERFALYKNFKDRIQEGDKLEQRQNDYLAEFDTTPSTTTISARAREKIQNLRSFIKSQLDDTVKKFSEALILLNATTGANVDQTDVNVTTPEERDIVYHKVYEHNPDELLHKTDVTFDIIERNAMLKTTTEQPQTFSPWATHIQNYNRFEYEPVNNETTVVIFSEDETVTYSPMYGFHRYYHDLNSSVDSRTVAPTTYAFLTKDKTDSFTLPSYDAEGTVFTYNIHEFDENKTPTIQSPWDISQKENLTLYKYPTELLIERYNTHITESTKLATQMETTGSDAIEIVNDPEIEKDISDIGKFSPPNMDEIKQYIDSVTKSRERFNKKNFEWDSENSAYTLIDETTTTKCPKIRQQNIEFIEALQNGGLRPSTREIITTELPTEKNTEETTVKTRGLKTYLQDILQKYSNEVPHGSAQKQENARIKQQLLQILELESKMNKLDEKLQTNKKESTTFQSKTKRPRTTLFCGLKVKLFSLLHKYTEEILNTNAIANNQTKKKYGKMKNVIRILVDNYSPGPETDILDPAWTVELTSKERKAFPERNSTNTNDEYHINLKQQIHHVLDEYPDDNKHDKTLKIMVRKALRDSFENLDTSEIDDDVVFNQTNFWDVSDYVTNDVCTDRRFKTGFRVKLRKLIRDFSKEILSKNNDLTSRERRVNKNIIQNIGAAVEAYSFGPETDALAEHLQKIEVSDEQPTSPRPKPLEGVEEKKNLRLQIENFMNAYKSDEHENTIEKESNTKLKKLVQDLIKDHSFEYSLTAEMQGLVKRLTTKEEQVTVRTTTVLNTEEQREVEEERRRRVPTYDYYDDHEEVATCKDPKTTLDYYELYKEKVTERTTTTLSESQQLRRDKYIKNVERMNHLLDQKVDEHAKKVLLQHTTKKRPRLTTPDSQETDETSEEEPFTYRTMSPIETRIEYEFSDSRDFEIPFHDITVTKYTERFEDGLYTPGQGFENRSTIPESDEYRRAQRPFRYELANPVFKDPNVPRYLVPLEMLTPETTTVDYYSFYRQKMKKTTTGATEPTKDPAALARYREKFIANVDAFNRKLSEEVAAAHTGRVKVRPRLTTPDSEHTDEESEMEPFTFYTAQPTERRVEMEFSDSREYYVPLLGITLSTLLPYPENVYTPGQGFENRSTVPEDDEYARAQWRFKYDPQIEIDRQGLTFSHDLYTRTSRPPSSPSTPPPTTLRPLHRLFARWRAWKDKPLGDRFDSLKQAVNKSRLGGQFDSLKQAVNSSLLSWKGKVDGFVNRMDRRAHRIIHAWYDVKDNCSVEH